MTKQIHPNSMVAHIWAHQSQDSARSGNGNVSFDGAKLYSYAALIGRIVTGVNGQTVFLISDGTHHRNSVTTSGHISSAMGAAHGNGAVFSVPSLSNYGEPDHNENLASLVKTYQSALARLHRMRDNPESWDIERVQDAAMVAIRYANTFEMARPEIDFEIDIAAMREFRAARDARNNTPEQIAKRERERALRMARKEKHEAEQKRLAMLAAADAVAAWRQGYGYLPWNARTDEAGGALLRIRGDILETSLGASVPLQHAIAAFRRVAACRTAGIGWQRNGELIRVGHFQIDQINPDGSFRAGCHLINWAEVESAARVAGIVAD